MGVRVERKTDTLNIFGIFNEKFETLNENAMKTGAENESKRKQSLIQIHYSKLERKTKATIMQ